LSFRAAWIGPTGGKKFDVRNGIVRFSTMGAFLDYGTSMSLSGAEAVAEAADIAA
jgi:hypothetical protein